MDGRNIPPGAGGGGGQYPLRVQGSKRCFFHLQDTLTSCPGRLWKRTWRANAVWVRGFRKARRLQKQVFQWWVCVCRGGFSDPSYQHLGSGLLTLSSCGQLGLEGTSNNLLWGQVGSCIRTRGWAVVSLVGRTSQDRKPHKLTHIMWVLGSREENPYSIGRRSETLRRGQ